MYPECLNVLNKRTYITFPNIALNFVSRGSQHAFGGVLSPGASLTSGYH